MQKIIVAALCMLLTFGALALPHVAAAPNAVIQNDSSYVNAYGYLHIVGEVLNTGDAWLMFPKVTGTLKDSNGQVLDVISEDALLIYLPPGGRGPFNLHESDVTKSSKVSSYTLALEYQPADSIPQVDLMILNATSTVDATGSLNVVGEIKNTGANTSVSTMVFATFYDQSGKVILVDSAFLCCTLTVYSSEITPGQTSGFRIIESPTDTGQIPKITGWTLVAESLSGEHISVPWPK